MVIGDWEYNFPRAVAFQPDGKILVGGALGSAKFVLVRLLPNGNIDTGFGSNGIVTTAFSDAGRSGDRGIRAISIQSDGRIVAGGAGGGEYWTIARYTTDGALDTSFGTGGLVTGRQDPSRFGRAEVVGVATLPDGRIVAVGNTPPNYIISNYTGIVLSRYVPDGSLDPSFGTGGEVADVALNGTSLLATSLAIDASGGYLVAGSMRVASDTSMLVARYDVSGSIDSAFGVYGKARARIAHYHSGAHAIEITSDGRIVLAGWSRSAAIFTEFQPAYPPLGFVVARLLANGTPDGSYGGGFGATNIPGGDWSTSQALDVQPDGKIVAGGYLARGNSNTQYFFALARFLGGP